MSVSATHPEYDETVGKWILVRDVVSSKVKRYIKDVEIGNKLRNERYKDDARFTNFTSRTKAGLVGAAFRKDPIIDLPVNLEYLVVDSTGSKTPLVKLAQEITGEVIQFGRYGLLVDYPASEDGLTASEVSDLNLKARINRYKPESIINWHVDIINGIPKLVLVVLKEELSILDDDGFTWRESVQYRALKMVEGKYVQLLFDEHEELVHAYEPRDFNGDAWTDIPFVFIGSEDNDTDVDVAPMYDLAELNLGHLRNSADYEESIHITGQPTLVLSTDLSAEEFKAANPDGVLIGARRGHNLGASGNAFFLEASPNQLADTAMQRKEQQAVMIGARLITAAGSNETAEAARIKHSGEMSVLSGITGNVESGLIQAIRWVSVFMEPQESEDIFVKLNRDFFDKTLDPQMMMAQIQLVNSGIKAVTDVRTLLRKTGDIDETRSDDDIDSDLDQLNPLV